MAAVPAEVTAPAKQARAASTKVRPKRALPTDRIRFEKQVDLLSAFVLASRGGADAVTSEDIARHTPMSSATAGLNNIFFMESGLLVRESKGRYRPVEPVVEFHRERGWGEPHASAILAPTLANTWYYAETSRRDELGPMTRSQLVTALANAAKADTSDLTKAELLVEWLEYVGLVAPGADNNVMAVELHDVEGVKVEYKAAVRASPASEVGQGATPAPHEFVAGSTRGSTKPVLSLAFNLAITAADMSTLSGDQIAALFEGVAKVATVQASRTNAKDE